MLKKLKPVYQLFFRGSQAVAKEEERRSKKPFIDQMTDAELGAFVRRAMAALEKYYGQQEDGRFHYGLHAGAGMALIRAAADMNADRLNMTVTGASTGARSHGDWEIRVQKMGSETTEPAGELREVKDVSELDTKERITELTIHNDFTKGGRGSVSMRTEPQA